MTPFDTFKCLPRGTPRHYAQLQAFPECRDYIFIFSFTWSDASCFAQNLSYWAANPD